MSDEQGRRIPIIDRRVAHQDPDVQSASHSDEQIASESPLPETPSVPEGDVAPQPEEVEARNDFLDDLKRLQADFDNYRKRITREQAVTAGRAKARLVEQLLPVLDAFDQAFEHEGDAGGLEPIYKQFKTTLEAEGLEEIPAERVPFDPHVHDAVDSREDPSVTEIVTRSVYRRGYRLGDQVLRAAMVVVARPPDATASDAPEAAEG